MAYSPVSAGALDNRVTIQSKTSVDDDGGGTVETWANQATVWAGIEPGAGREFNLAKQLTPTLSHVVTMRFRAVKPNQRITYFSAGVARVLNIETVADPGERNEQVILYCSEILPE